MATNLEEPPFLGDYVVTTRHGHRGRVYQCHWYCPEDAQWQARQTPPLAPGDKEGKWVGVLVHNPTGGAGAVSVAATDCTVIEPFPFQHRDVAIYFRPEAR